MLPCQNKAWVHSPVFQLLALVFINLGIMCQKDLFQFSYLLMQEEVATLVLLDLLLTSWLLDHHSSLSYIGSERGNGKEPCLQKLVRYHQFPASALLIGQEEFVALFFSSLGVKNGSHITRWSAPSQDCAEIWVGIVPVHPSLLLMILRTSSVEIYLLFQNVWQVSL